VSPSQRLVGSLLVAIAAFQAAAPDARAADANQISQAGVDRMILLNKKAFGDLRSQHFQAAKYWLEEALVISETAGLEENELTARTRVHLAAVYMTGLRDRDEAVQQFLLALQINPDISITPGLETPALRSAYLQAREQAGLPPNPDPTAEASSQESFVPDSPEPDDNAKRRAASAGADQVEGGALIGIPDPDLPARVPVPLYCELPFEIVEGEDIIVRCLTQKLPRKSSASVHYRPQGGTSDAYTPLPLERSAKGWLVGVIPGAVVHGKALFYYVKANIPGQHEPIYLGRPEAPNTFIVRRKPAESDDDGSGMPADRAHRAPSRTPYRRVPGSLWFALGAGTGAAYHGRETVDSGSIAPGTQDPVAVDRGFSEAGLLQIEPEIGYQWSRRWSVSLQARYQYAPRDDQGSPPGAPALNARKVRTSAWAAFARTQAVLALLGDMQLFASGGLGAGTSFLATVDRHCGTTTCTLPQSDTLHGGALGLSAGIGATYFFGNHLGVFVEAKEIVTLPRVLALTEINMGLALSFRIRRAGISEGESKTNLAVRR
jgi:hypothetical protein